MRRSWIACTAALCLVASVSVAAGAPVRAAGVASVPRPDHVVIVVEENHSSQSIIGNPNAPYINSLASDGANMTKFFAETHPSQPNYVALFSGGTHGVTDDSCPQTLTGANLGSELLGSGAGFVGYSEDLPSAGSTVCFNKKYARKHNPWVDFTNVPASANQPFTAFPSDYSTLPDVSFVIPNLDDDMHDGTIAQGDAWLQNKLGGYITWAKTHNSLFVLTFDEDDFSQSNQIPTIFVGQQIVPGNYAQTYNHYNLLRTVEDAYGLAPVGASASADPILDIWAAPSGDDPPTAAFTSTCTQLACAFDANASFDQDGSITGYSWAFGDGRTGSGVTPNHTYSAAGTYAVRLTVTDNDNASSSITHQVTVTAPAGTPFASDAFNRSVTGGWGTADVGGAWVRSGTASAFSVANGSGRMQTAAGATLVEYLGSALSTDTDLVCTFSIDRLPVGGSMYVSITGRRVSSGNTYLDVLEIRPNGTANLRLARTVGGTQTLLQPQLTVPGLTVAANTAITVRLQVTGTSPTTLRTRAWPAGGAEPGQWQLTATDSSAALQAAGSVGLSNYLPAAVTNGPVTVGVDSLVAASSASGPPPNQSPVAAFTSTCTLRSCSFDANGSHDSDGQINSFAWTFGDGDTGSGTNPTHDYRTVGTFTVTLTVTDDDQATGSISHSVTTTQSTGTPVAFVAAAHGPAGSVRTEQVTVPTLAHAGDTMLLFFTHSTTATWTGPAGVTGWTELLTFTQGSIVSTAWTKTVAAGDVGAAVHLDSTGYSKGILELAVYSGASSTTAPIVGHAGDSARSGHVSPTITAAANDLVVTLWTDKSETTTSWAAPAGVTTRDTALGTGGGRYGGLLADSGGPVAAGSYGGLTATTNAASGLGAMWTVALAPAG